MYSRHPLVPAQTEAPPSHSFFCPSSTYADITQSGHHLTLKNVIHRKHKNNSNATKVFQMNVHTL